MEGREDPLPRTDNPNVECAVYPGAGVLALVNSSFDPQTVTVSFGGRQYREEIEGCGMKTLQPDRES